MIHLISVGMRFRTASGAVKVVLEPTTIGVPTDRRVAILARKQQGKSVFLQLLAGVEKPVEGRILLMKKLSPILRYGVLFNRKLSFFENITFYARMMGLDPATVAEVVDEFCDLGGGIGVPIDREQGEQRRIAEIGMMSMLPFDCYLIDEIWTVPEKIRLRFFDSCEQRGAGAIFTTKHVQLARRYAECAVVIRDGRLYSFSSVDDGIKCLEG